MTKRWFISYRMVRVGILEDSGVVEYCNVITDVTPATWILESQYAIGGERVILYAEEITQSLAVQLAHGGPGVPTAYFHENV